MTMSKKPARTAESLLFSPRVRSVSFSRRGSTHRSDALGVVQPVRRRRKQAVDKAKLRVLTGSDCCVVEYIPMDKYAEIDGDDGVRRIIHMPGTYARSTRGLSMLPGTEDLAQMDAGGCKANLGRLIVPPVKNHDDLKAGDIVLYDQHSAKAGFTMQSAQLLKELLETEGNCYVIPTAAVASVLEDGIPQPGQLQ
jgi:hypothetical protein